MGAAAPWRAATAAGSSLQEANPPRALLLLHHLLPPQRHLLVHLLFCWGGERGDRGKAGGGSNPHWAPTFSMVASLSGNTGDFTAPSIRQPKPTSHPSVVTPLLGGSGWGHLLPYPGPQPTPRLDWFRRVGRGLGRGFQGPLLNRQLLKVEGQGLLPVKQGAPPPPSLLRSWDKLITFSSAR